jgi:transposase
MVAQTTPFTENLGRHQIIEWIDKSQGRVRADVVHRKLEAMGYQGSERTTRRVVAALKDDWTQQHRRGYKPWIPEPGLWLQWDYGDGPWVDGVKTQLFCAWLAWSRFRVILPLWDKKLPSVIAALDRCFRIIGGIPTYALTDNEKTVTDLHIARVAVRNPKIVAAAHYYGVTITTCLPADPESKGGSEATVRIAKADLVPTAANLLDEYEVPRGGVGEPFVLGGVHVGIPGVWRRARAAKLLTLTNP